MSFSSVLKLIVSILVCQLAGFVGSLLTTPSIPTWYEGLSKPSFNPPNWIFSPVWITLYVLMGISLFLVWQKGVGSPQGRMALVVFFCQLALNILWSLFFFHLHLPFLAFVEILVLWLAILVTIMSFYRISKLAAVLLFPYILWVSFAAILNFSLWRLNL
ncbi:MAG: TspO/MBR family protein [Candidatus Aminicenantales bacterium]